jgi:hypothetical protein
MKIHIFLTSALAGGEWSASRLGRFIPGKRAPGTHWAGGWVDLSAIYGDESSASLPGRFTSGERAPGSHSVRGWVGLRAVLETVEKRKILVLTGNRTRQFQLVARCYAD